MSENIDWLRSINPNRVNFDFKGYMTAYNISVKGMANQVKTSRETIYASIRKESLAKRFFNRLLHDKEKYIIKQDTN